MRWSFSRMLEDWEKNIFLLKSWNLFAFSCNWKYLLICHWFLVAEWRIFGKLCTSVRRFVCLSVRRFVWVFATHKSKSMKIRIWYEYLGSVYIWRREDGLHSPAHPSAKLATVLRPRVTCLQNTSLECTKEWNGINQKISMKDMNVFPPEKYWDLFSLQKQD